MFDFNEDRFSLAMPDPDDGSGDDDDDTGSIT
jgi:hypothetical protein